MGTGGCARRARREAARTVVLPFGAIRAALAEGVIIAGTPVRPYPHEMAIVSADEEQRMTRQWVEHTNAELVRSLRNFANLIQGKAVRNYIKSVPVPGIGNSPVRLCHADPDRDQLLLLNEDPNNDIRFSENLKYLGDGLGALLWHGTNSYTKFDSQDEIWAIGVTANTVNVSVIQVTRIAKENVPGMF